MDFIKCDRTLAVGDLVIHRYTKNSLIHRITKIERRYLDKYSVNWGAYAGGSIGDEYNPLISIVQVGDVNVGGSDKVKKITKTLDGAYIIKLTPQAIDDHMNRLRKMFDALMENT